MKVNSGVKILWHQELTYKTTFCTNVQFINSLFFE